PTAARASCPLVPRGGMKRALLLVSFVPSLAFAQSLTYGPILGRGVTGDRMIVKWGSGSATDPTAVQLRKKGATAFSTVNGAAAADHEVELSGLAVDTEYEYQVAGATHSFTTCPAPGMPMSVVFYGDSRTYP